MLKLKRLEIKNWKNFLEAGIELKNRMFIVGPNASGKSNLLDIFRFLRDITKAGGGLQFAVKERGGISQIRCLHARRETNVRLCVTLYDNNEDVEWEYSLSFYMKSQFPKKLLIKEEKVKKSNDILLLRPDEEDKKDEDRLMQTHLEQVIANKEYRHISVYFQSFCYRHVVPQLIRYSQAFKGTGLYEDPYGQNFLDTLKKTPKRTRDSRLNKIEKALNIIVPNLKKLNLVDDELGIPHLEVMCDHWRPHAGKQKEDQFSDGTLRFIGLLWSILDSKSILLLEEPELSLHDAVVSKLPSLISRVQQEKTQIIMSTHSLSILSDPGIGSDEIILLIPHREGTKVRIAESITEIDNLMKSGMSAADVVIPFTKPPEMVHLELFS